MKRSERLHSTEVSRRCLLRGLALAGGSASLLAANFVRPADAAQVSQKLVAYQDTPHNAQECDNCAQFLEPSSCKVVEGTVSPKGWCKVYVKKPAT